VSHRRQHLKEERPFLNVRSLLQIDVDCRRVLVCFLKLSLFFVSFGQSDFERNLCKKWSTLEVDTCAQVCAFDSFENGEKVCVAVALALRCTYCTE